jgi:hypothetical protein
MAQSRVQIVGQLHGRSLHGYASIPSEPSQDIACRSCLCLR